jgi:multimeric flavodoxin WrbA
MSAKKKKIIVVLGSPVKDGSTATLARKIAEGAKDSGAEIKEIFLQDLQISPCKGCGACQKKNSRKCVIKDDMQKIYPDLQDADGFILATPVYWCSMSAQLKTFLDRTYALVELKTFTTIFTNRKLALAISYGDPDVLTSGTMNIVRNFQDILNFSRGECIGILHCTGKADKKLLDTAYETGKKF